MYPLADKVKAYQRLGEIEEWNWWTFAAQYGDSKDPARFEPSVLEHFVSLVDMSALEGPFGKGKCRHFPKGKGKGNGKALMFQRIFGSMNYS